jgi:hypothetical protein
MTCAQCIECVDGEGQGCAEAHEACNGVTDCELAVTCLVNCALGIDCFEECCRGLDEQQLLVVNELFTCKAEECSEACATQAEFSACP